MNNTPKKASKGKEDYVIFRQLSESTFLLGKGSAPRTVDMGSITFEETHDLLDEAGLLSDNQAGKIENLKETLQNAVNKKAGIDLFIQALIDKQVDLEPKRMVFFREDPKIHSYISREAAAELVSSGQWSYTPEKITVLVPLDQEIFSSFELMAA